jgi:hypothetical protein
MCFITGNTFHGALQKFRSRSNSWRIEVLECCGLYCVLKWQKGSVDACQPCPVSGSLWRCGGHVSWPVQTGPSTPLPYNSCRMKSSYPAHLPEVITAPHHILPFLSFKTHCTCVAILTWIADRTLWDTQKQVSSWLMCNFLLLAGHKSWINSYKPKNNVPFMFTWHWRCSICNLYTKY